MEKIDQSCATDNKENPWYMYTITGSKNLAKNMFEQFLYYTSK